MLPTIPDGAESAVRWSDAWRCDWLRRIVALGLLAGFLLSPRLWLTERNYPLAPIADDLPVIAAPFDLLWFIVLLALLIAIAAFGRRRTLLIAFLVLAGALALFDQTRWQPWFYQYLFMLGALACPNRLGGLQAGRLVVAGTYFWSGLNKVNAAFIQQVFPWLVQPVLAVLPESAHAAIGSMGYLGPLTEVTIAVGLLIPRFRPMAVGLAIAVHLMILVCIGPLGHRWNSIVWPWNIAMICVVVVLFVRAPAVNWKAILWPARAIYPRVALALFGILPVGHFLGWWDSYLSSALFSGNTLRGEIVIAQGLKQRLPERCRAYAQENDGTCKIDVLAWSLGELNVPDYPERRVFRQVARTVARWLDADVTLVIHERPDWWSGKRRHTICTLHHAAGSR